jgi:Zn-dependent protease with chaperone function
MTLPPAERIFERVSSAARKRLLWIAIIVALFLIIAIAAFDHATAGKLRGDMLFLVQVGSLVFLVIYVIATNRIAQSNESAAKATQESADAAKRATEIAIRSTETAEAMLNEARATRQAQEKQAAPRVVVYADLDGLTRYLTVENVG